MSGIFTAQDAIGRPTSQPNTALAGRHMIVRVLVDIR